MNFSGNIYPIRKQVTATFLDAKLVRSDGSERSTTAAFLFNLGATRFYPEPDPTHLTQNAYPILQQVRWIREVRPVAICFSFIHLTALISENSCQ